MVDSRTQFDRKMPRDGDVVALQVKGASITTLAAGTESPASRAQPDSEQHPVPLGCSGLLCAQPDGRHTGPQPAARRVSTPSGRKTDTRKEAPQKGKRGDGCAAAALGSEPSPTRERPAPAARSRPGPSCPARRGDDGAPAHFPPALLHSP